mgnify:CR=1 FL=1
MRDEDMLDEPPRKRTTVRKLGTTVILRPDGLGFAGENLRSLERAIRSVLRMRDECRFKYHHPIFPHGAWVYVTDHDGGVRIRHGMLASDGIAVHTLTARSVKRHLKLFRRMRHGIRYEGGNVLVNGRRVPPAHWSLVFRTAAFRHMAEGDQIKGSPLAKAYRLWLDKPGRDQYEAETEFQLPGENYDDFVARLR